MTRPFSAPSMLAAALLAATLAAFPAAAGLNINIPLPPQNILAKTKTCKKCVQPRKDFKEADEKLRSALSHHGEVLRRLEEFKKVRQYGNEFDEAVAAVKAAEKDVAGRKTDSRNAKLILDGALSRHLEQVKKERTVALATSREAHLKHAKAAYKLARARIAAKGVRKSIAGGLDKGKFKPYASIKHKVDLTEIVDASIALESQGEGPHPILEAIMIADGKDNDSTKILFDNFKYDRPIMIDFILGKNKNGEIILDENAKNKINAIQKRYADEVTNRESNVKEATMKIGTADTKTRDAKMSVFVAEAEQSMHNNMVKETNLILGPQMTRASKVLAEAEKDRADKDKSDKILGITDGLEEKYYEEGDPAEAKAYLDGILARDPSNPEARSARALANSKLGNHASACVDAQMALQGNPNDRRAFAVMKLSCPSGTVAPTPSFGNISPGGQEGYPGDMYAANRPARGPSASGGVGPPRMRGPPGMGGPGMMPPGASVPKNVRGSFALTKKAGRLMREGNLDGAIAAATEAIRMNPRNAGAYFMRAMAFNGKGEYENALADASAGLRLKPGNLQLLNAMAFAQNKLGDFRDARETAWQAIKADPKNAAAYANLGYALGMLGDRGGMLSALRKAAALDPRFDESLRSALETPSGGDYPFLFPGESRPKEAAKTGGKAGTKKLMLVFFMTLIIIGLLAALYPLRAKIRATVLGTQENTPSDLPGMTRSPATLPPAGSDGTMMTQGIIIGGNYELGSKIGEGGMGAVFKAYDRKLDRQVAMKKMLPELRNSPREMERFLKEARIVSHLSHPYIVGIHDILNQDGDVFLVFDFVDGKPLSGIIDEKGRLPLKDCRTYFSQICQAVAHAHAHNILHRDLKPANIMIDKAGFAKVMDFGIAREAKQSISRLTHKDTSGTPVYMAPEQHLGEAGKPADIFALGVCLYEAMTGELPFKGPDFLAQKERMRFIPPTKIVPGLPKAADVLMTAALAAEPGKRIADADELKDSLEKLV